MQESHTNSNNVFLYQNSAQFTHRNKIEKAHTNVDPHVP